MVALGPRSADTPESGPRTSLERYVLDANRKCYVIPVARACNAACSFCATDEYDPNPTSELMPLDGFSGIVRLLRAVGVERFEITGGGEPALHPALCDIVAAIRAEAPVQVKLYSNGIRLWPNVGVDELNISRVALDPERNQLVMKFRSGNRPLPDIVTEARTLGYQRIRLSVPLVQGGVSTIEDATRFVEEVGSLVEAIVFRPLYPATPNRADLHRMTEDASEWTSALNRFNDNSRGATAELDAIGCFRSEQLILASDLRLYGDWSLTRCIDGGGVA